MFTSISSCVPNTQVLTSYKADTDHLLDIWSNVTVRVNFLTSNVRPIAVKTGDYIEALIVAPVGNLSRKFIPYSIDGRPQYFAVVNRNNFNPTVRAADIQRKWYNYVNFSQEISFHETNNEIHLQNLSGWNKNLIDVEELHIVLDTLSDSVHFYSRQREMIHRIELPAGPIEYRKISSIAGYTQYSFDLLVICSDYRLYRVFFDSRYVVSDEFKPKVIPLFSLDNLPYTQDLPNGLSFLDLARARFLARLFPIVTALDVTPTTIWLAGSEEVYKLNTKFQLISKITIAGEEVVCVAALQTGALVTTKKQRIFYVDGSTSTLLHQSTVLGSPASINSNNQVVVPDCNNQRLLVFSDSSGTYTIWPTPDFVPAYARVFDNTLWVTGHDSLDVLKYINNDAYVRVGFDEKVTLISVVGSSILASHYLKDYKVLDTTGIQKIIPFKFPSRAGPVSHIGSEPQRVRMIGDQNLTMYASPGLTAWTNGIANEPVNQGDWVSVSYKGSAEGRYRGAVILGEHAIDYTVDVFSNSTFYDHYVEVDPLTLEDPENVLVTVDTSYLTVTSGNLNSGIVSNIALDFTWNQYGQYYSNINVATNGYITFDNDYYISSGAAAIGSIPAAAIQIDTKDLYQGFPIDNRNPANITVGNLTTGETPGVFVQNQNFRNFEGKRIRWVGTRMDALPLGVSSTHQTSTVAYNKTDIELAAFNLVKVGDYVSGNGFSTSTTVVAKRAYNSSFTYYKTNTALGYVLMIMPYADIERYSSFYIGTTRYGFVTGTSYTSIPGNRYLGFVGNTIIVDGRINPAVNQDFLIESFGSRYYYIDSIAVQTQTITSLLSTTANKIFVSLSDLNQVRLIQTIDSINRYVIFKETTVKTFTATADRDYITEGNSCVITITTTNISNGTVIPYSITGVTVEDITAPLSLSGNIVISGGTASLTITANADMVNESLDTVSITFGSYSDIVSNTTTIQIDLEDENTSNRQANSTSVSSSVTEYALVLNSPATVTAGQSLSYEYTEITFDRKLLFNTTIGANLVYQFNRLDLTSLPPTSSNTTNFVLRANLITLSQTVSASAGESVLFKTYEPAPTVSYEVGLYTGLNFQFIEIFYPVRKTMYAGITKRMYEGYFDDSLNFFKIEKPFYTGVETQLTISANVSYQNGRSYEWVGYFRAQQTGIHNFTVSSDDAAYVWLGVKPAGSYTTANAFLQTPGRHATAYSYASIALIANQYYPIRILYGDGGGLAVFNLTYTVTGSATVQTMQGKLYRAEPYVDGPLGPVMVGTVGNVQFGPTSANSTVYSDFVSAPRLGSHLFGSNLNDGQWVYLGPGSFTEINQGFNGRHPRLVRVDRDDDVVQYEFLIEQNFPTFTEVLASVDYGSIVRNGANYTGYGQAGTAPVKTNDYFVLKIPVNISLRPIAPIFSIGNYQVAIPTAPNAVYSTYQQLVNLYNNQEYAASVSGEITITQSGSYFIPDIYKGALRRTGIDYELYRIRSGVKTYINPGTHEFLINDRVGVENLLTSRRYHDITEIVIVGPQTVTITFKTKHEPVFGQFTLDPLQNPYVRQLDYGPDGLYLEPDVKYASNSHVLSSSETVYSTRLFVEYPGVEIIINDQQMGPSASGVKTADVLRLRHTVNSYFEEAFNIFQHIIDYDSGSIYIPIGQWSVNNLPISDQGVTVNHSIADNDYRLFGDFVSFTESRASMPDADDVLSQVEVILDTPDVDTVIATESLVPMPGSEHADPFTEIYEDMPLPELIDNYTFSKLVIAEQLIADFTIDYEDMPPPMLIENYSISRVDLLAEEDLADLMHTIIYEPMPVPVMIEPYSLVRTDSAPADAIDVPTVFNFGFIGTEFLLPGTRVYVDIPDPDTIENYTISMFAVDGIDRINVETEFEFAIKDIERAKNFTEISQVLPDPDEIENFTEFSSGVAAVDVIKNKTEFEFNFETVEVIANKTEFDFGYTQKVDDLFTEFQFGFDYIEKIAVFTESIIDAYAVEVIDVETEFAIEKPETNLIAPFSYETVNPGEYYLPDPFSYVVFDDKGFEQIAPFTYKTVPPGEYYPIYPFSYVIFDDKGFEQIEPFTYKTVPPGEYYPIYPYSYVVFDDKGFEQIAPFTYTKVPPGEYYPIYPYSYVILKDRDYKQIVPFTFGARPGDYRLPKSFTYHNIGSYVVEKMNTNLLFDRSSEEAVKIAPIPSGFNIGNDGYTKIPVETWVRLDDYDALVIDPFTALGYDLADPEIIALFTETGTDMPEVKMLHQYSESVHDVTRRGLVNTLTDFRRDLEFVFFYNDPILYDNNSRGEVMGRSFNTRPLEFTTRDINLMYWDNLYEYLQNGQILINNDDNYNLVNWNLFYNDMGYWYQQHTEFFDQHDSIYEEFNLFYNTVGYTHLQNSLFELQAPTHVKTDFTEFMSQTGYEYLTHTEFIPDTVLGSDYAQYTSADGVYVTSDFFAYQPWDLHNVLQEQLLEHTEDYFDVGYDLVYYTPWDTGRIEHQYIQSNLRLEDLAVVPEPVSPTETQQDIEHTLELFEQYFLSTEALLLTENQFYSGLEFVLEDIPINFLDVSYELAQETQMLVDTEFMPVRTPPTTITWALDFTFFDHTILAWDIEFEFFEISRGLFTRQIDFDLIRPEWPEFATGYGPELMFVNEQYFDSEMIKDQIHYVEFASGYAPILNDITLRMFETGYSLTWIHQVDFSTDFVPEIYRTPLQFYQTFYDFEYLNIFTVDSEFQPILFKPDILEFLTEYDFASSNEILLGGSENLELVGRDYVLIDAAYEFLEHTEFTPDIEGHELVQYQIWLRDLQINFQDQPSSIYLDIAVEYIVNDPWYLSLGYQFVDQSTAMFLDITMDDLLLHTQATWGIESEFVKQPSQSQHGISETFYKQNPVLLDIGYEHEKHEQFLYDIGYELFIESFIYQNIVMQYLPDNRYLFDIVVFGVPVNAIPLTSDIGQEYAQSNVTFRNIDFEFFKETQFLLDVDTIEFFKETTLLFDISMNFFEPHYLEFDITNNIDVDRGTLQYGDLDFTFFKPNLIDSGTEFAPELIQANDRFGSLDFEMTQQHLIDFSSNFMPELRENILRMFHLGYDLIAENPYLVDIKEQLFTQSIRTIYLDYELIHPHLAFIDTEFLYEYPTLIIRDMPFVLYKPELRYIDLTFEEVRPTQPLYDLPAQLYQPVIILLETYYELLKNTIIYRDSEFERIDHTIILRDAYYEYVEHTQIWRYLYNEQAGFTKIFIDGPTAEQELYKDVYESVLELFIDRYTTIDLSITQEVESGSEEPSFYLVPDFDDGATEFALDSGYFFDGALSEIQVKMGLDFLKPEQSEKISLRSDFVNIEENFQSIFLDPELYNMTESLGIKLEQDLDAGAIGSFLLESEFVYSPSFNRYYPLPGELEDSTDPFYGKVTVTSAGAASQFTMPLVQEFVAYNKYTKNIDAFLVREYGLFTKTLYPDLAKPSYHVVDFEPELDRDPLWEMPDITKYGAYRTLVQRFAKIKNPSETFHDKTYCLEIPENQTVVFECPKNYIIRTVNFASFGTPNGNCGTFSANTVCHSSVSQTVAEQILLNRSGNIAITANTILFGNPGAAANRRLVVQFTAVRAGRFTKRDDLFRATGGERTYFDDYAYHTYHSSSTFVPAENMDVEFLVIGGGGGGGGDDSNPLGSGLGLSSLNPFASLGSGGGSGGAVYGVYSVRAGQTVTVFVGQGGQGGSVLGAGGAGGITSGPNFEIDIYNEGTNANVALANWSNSTTKFMTDFGGIGSMVAHQGLPNTTLTFSLANLDTHQEIRLQFYWHSVGSLDGEYNELRIDGTKWYSFSKSFRSGPGVSYLKPGASAIWSGHKNYSYQPYGGSAPDGYTVFDTGYFAHNSSSLTAAFQFGHDEPDDNEAQYISHVKVSTRKVYDSSTTRGGNGGNAGAQGRSGGGGGGGSFSGIATSTASYSYAEPTTLNSTQLQYWNNTATFAMTNLGGLGAVTAHGPLNNSTFTITHPLPFHARIRYQVYYHCVDSFDGETQEIRIDGRVWARFTKGYNTAPVYSINLFASAVWTPASYSFSPAGFSSLEGYIKFDTGYFNHDAATIKVEHQCGLDENQNNEAAYLSNVRINIPADIIFLGVAGGGAGGGGANEGYANNVTAPGGGSQPNSFIDEDFAGSNGASFIGDGGGGGGGGSGRWGGVGQVGIMSGGQASGGGNFVNPVVTNGVRTQGFEGNLNGNGGTAVRVNIPYPFSAGAGGMSNRAGSNGAVVMRYLKREVIPDFVFFEREYTYGLGGFRTLQQAGEQANRYASAVPFKIPGTDFFNYRILFNTQIYAVLSRPPAYYYPESKLSAPTRFFSNIGSPIPYDHTAPADNTVKYVVAQRKRWPMLWLIRGG